MIFTAQSLRRMTDVEFVSELLIGILHGPQAGNARAIDEYYVQYEDYDDEYGLERLAMLRFGIDDIHEIGATEVA
jgi:hypothetical protein